MEVSYFMKKFFEKSIIFYIFALYCFVQQTSLAIEHRLPVKVQQYGENYSQTVKKKIKIYYVMRWHDFKVYRISTVEKGVIYGGTPRYILYNKKEIRRPTKEENVILQQEAIQHNNIVVSKKYEQLTHRLAGNLNKTMNIIDETLPPDIPPVIIKYADKYMIKGNDRNIMYLMDWNDQHVYRTCWSRYPSQLHPYAIILYDGNTIRRPSKEEYDNMHSALQDALFNRLNALRLEDNKD